METTVIFDSCIQHDEMIQADGNWILISPGSMFYLAYKQRKEALRTTD